MTERLKFFVDPAWRNTVLPHTPLLYPFWGISLDASRTPFLHALFSQRGYDRTQYDVVEDLSFADAILLPYNYPTCSQRAPDTLAAALRLSETSGKLLLIDGVTDVEDPISYKNCIILRYGGYRFAPDPRVVVIPPYTEDLLERYYEGSFHPKKKQHPARVGFAGWGSLTLVQRARTILKEFPSRVRGIFDSRYRAMKKGVLFREKAMHILERSSLVEAHFLARPSYSGHIHTVSNDADTLRRQFIENLRESDYGLDVRGDANASTRLFEMLSLGCIPVIVDTERNFPFADEVDYSSFSVRVDFRDLASLPERIATFHATITDAEFEAMQQRAREVYVKHFRIDAVTRHVMESVRNRIATTYGSA